MPVTNSNLINVLHSILLEVRLGGLKQKKSFMRSGFVLIMLNTSRLRNPCCSCKIAAQELYRTPSRNSLMITGLSLRSL